MRIPESVLLASLLLALAAGVASVVLTTPVFRAQALNAAQFSAWWSYFNLLLNKEGFLPPVEREMVAVVVSTINRCTYCAVSHGAALRGLLVQDGQKRIEEGADDA